MEQQRDDEQLDDEQLDHEQLDNDGEPHEPAHSAFETGMPRPGALTRSSSVARTLLLSALVGLGIHGLAYQLAIGDTAFSRPGELALVFIDIGTVLWFGVTAVLLRTLRWQTIDARFRWIMLAALIAVTTSVAVRTLALGESFIDALVTPVSAGLLLVALAAIAFTRARVRRLALGSDDGIGLVGGALGAGLVAAGFILGALRVQVDADALASPLAPSAGLPLLPLLAATAFVAGALVLTLVDRARRR